MGTRPTSTEADPGVLTTSRAMLSRYPLRSLLVVLLTFLASMAEVVGVVALLPLLGYFVGEDQELGTLGELLEDVLAVLGVTPTVGVLLTLIVLGITTKGVLRIIAMQQAGYAAAHVGMDLRLDLIRSLMRAQWSYFTRQPTGGLANAVSSEAQRASLVFTKSTELVAKLIQVVVYVGLAFVVSWQVALVTLFAGVGMIGALNFLVRLARAAGLRHTVLLKSLISRLSDGLYAIKPMKAMSKEDNLRPLLEEETRELNETQRQKVISKAALESLHEPIVAFFVAVLMFVLLEALGVPFSEVLFVAFLFYRTITYVGSLQKLAQAFVEVQSAYWSIQRAIDDAEEHAEHLSPASAVHLRDSITFDRASFSYADTPILKDASFRIPAREMTAFVGPSGTGKTTIADLIVGLYLPDAGRILIDGVDIADADLRSWRRRIGYVPQELILFHDTVYVNVAMGDHSISREEVEEALRAAGAWDFVQALPQGIDTMVGEHGMRLSGGQRQRLAIARALVTRPDLLILDEATTALDPETERAILHTLSGLKRDVTIVAISHQSGLVLAADHVFRLEPGGGGAQIRVEEPHGT